MHSDSESQLPSSCVEAKLDSATQESLSAGLVLYEETTYRARAIFLAFLRLHVS